MDQAQKIALLSLSTNQLINYIRDRGYAVAAINLDMYSDTVDQAYLEQVMIDRGHIFLEAYD